MMRSELQEDGPNVNIVTQSGIATEEDKGKQPRENIWVCKVAHKEDGFDLNKENETFMEGKKSFADSRASTSKIQGARMEKPEEVIAM